MIEAWLDTGVLIFVAQSLHSISVYQWSQWGQYGQCSRYCGGGVQHRQRTCSGKHVYGNVGNSNRQCYGPSSSQKRCNQQSCTGRKSFRIQIHFQRSEPSQIVPFLCHDSGVISICPSTMSRHSMIFHKQTNWVIASYIMLSKWGRLLYWYSRVWRTKTR